MSDLFYALYSPSRNKWRNTFDQYGPFSEAEKFPSPDKAIDLENDERWVGPLAEGSYE